MTELLNPKSLEIRLFYFHHGSGCVPEAMRFFIRLLAVFIFSPKRFLGEVLSSSQIEERQKKSSARLIVAPVNMQSATYYWCTISTASLLTALKVSHLPLRSEFLIPDSF